MTSSGDEPAVLGVQISLRQLSGLLWRERVLLDRLADDLVSDEPDSDPDALYRMLSALELHRAIAARDAAAELGVRGDATLRELLHAAPAEWAEVLGSHRRALVDLANEVARLTRRTVIRLDDPAARRPGVQRSLREFLA